MNIRPLESLTKEELIELIKHERADHCEDILHMAPKGWQLVPVEPTLSMLYAALIAWRHDTLRRSSAMYTAMIAATPKFGE